MKALKGMLGSVASVQRGVSTLHSSRPTTACKHFPLALCETVNPTLVRLSLPTVPPVCSLPLPPSQSDMELRAVSSACDASKVHSLPPSHSRGQPSHGPWPYAPCSLYSCHAWNNEDDSLAFAQTTEITTSSTGLESPSSASARL